MKLMTAMAAVVFSMSVFAGGEITCERLNSGLYGVHSAKTYGPDKTEIGEKTLFIKKTAAYKFQVLATSTEGKAIGSDQIVVSATAQGCKVTSEAGDQLGLSGSVSPVTTPTVRGTSVISNVTFTHADGSYTVITEKM